MAGFRRRRTFRRRFGRRRPRVRRFIRKIRRITKGTIRRMSEVKWAVNNAYSTVAPDVLSIQEVTPPTAQGLSKYGGRIGSKIKYKFMTFDMSFDIRDTAIVPGDSQVYLCRVILFTARQPTITIGDLFPSGGFGYANVWLPADGTNVKVLKDWKFICSTQINMTDISYPHQQNFRRLKYYKRVNQNVNYRTNAATLPVEPHDKFYVAFGFAGNFYALTPPGVRAESYWFNRLSYFDI